MTGLARVAGAGTSTWDQEAAISTGSFTRGVCEGTYAAGVTAGASSRILHMDKLALARLIQRLVVGNTDRLA